MRVAVAVATFGRNEQLSLLLDSLAVASEHHPLRVIIVDNDPSGAAECVATRAGLDITYAVEPTPGIPFARNRALDLLRSGPDGDDAVVFVDDDEVVDPEWLHELVAAADRYHADVVAGPVLTSFLDSTPRWLAEGGYVQRPNPADGTPIEQAATNNALVTMAVLERAGHPRFDADFAETGGEDTEFFWRLNRLPARMVWCSRAVVREVHPASRATLRWVWQRGVRIANIRGRLLLRERSRLRVAAEGVARLGHGVIVLAVVLVRTRRVRYPELNRVTHGIGLLRAACGRRQRVDEHEDLEPVPAADGDEPVEREVGGHAVGVDDGGDR